MKKDNLKVKRYIEQADKYITQGNREIKDGDLRQAGEKYWGGATQILKAYCELKGWFHDGHAKLFQDVGEISKRLGDQKPMEQFCLAALLHTNFYEGWLTKKEIEDYANEVKTFCGKIKGILNKEEIQL